MSQKKKYDFDGLFIDLKSFGKYQIRQTFTVISIAILECFSILQIVFLGYAPDHQCKDLSEEQLSIYNVTSYDVIDYEKCHVNIFRGLKNTTDQFSCINGYNYSENKDISFVTEWDLVCDKDGLAELTQSLFTVGQAVGALMFTSIADRIGRKPVHAGCAFLLMLCVSGSSLSPNLWVFGALRCLSGALQQGIAIPGCSLILEMYPPDKRTLVSCSLGAWWGVSVMVLALVSYVMRHLNWRWMCASFGIPGLMFLFEIWYLRESVRWLFANGNPAKAERIVKRAAKLNGVDFETTWSKFLKSNEPTIEMNQLSDLSEERIERNGTNADQPKETAFGIWTIMKYRKTRNITFGMMFIWLITSLTYFGLYLTSSNLSGNRHLNFWLTASMEIPSCFILYKLLMIFGRRKTLMIFIGSSAVTLLIVAVLRSVGDSGALNATTVVLSMVGMFGISGAFAGLWLYTPEVYPTTMRNAGMGTASATGRIASMLSPYTRMLAARAVWGPGLVFGTGCFIASGLLLLLPETHNKRMPQNLDEMLALEEERNKEEGFRKRKSITSKNNEEI